MNDPGDRMFDVLVLGGGPAGSTVGIELARAGLSVGIIERTAYEGVRFGETLTPAVKRPLTRLGVWSRLGTEAHLRSPGVISLWGSDEVYENDFIASPFGEGWHIDRCAFDRMLAHEAVSHGAVLWEQANPASIRITEDGCDVTLDQHDTKIRVRARMLADCSGRSGRFIKHHGGVRRNIDRLIAVASTFQATFTDARTLLEAGPDGWWYSGLIPGDRAVVCYMTDADCIGRSPEHLNAGWASALQSVPATRSRLADAKQVSRLSILAADSFSWESITGPHWIAIGDAASGIDPLSSWGIIRALEHGTAAARAIQAHLAGQADAFALYERDVRREYEEYLLQRAWYYNRETRWPDSVFWQRRRETAPPSAADPLDTRQSQAARRAMRTRA